MDTLLNMLTEDEVRRVRLIKIDVEGGELAILRYLLDHLASFPPMMDGAAPVSSGQVA
jgi:FkbM family methyltransferase